MHKIIIFGILVMFLNSASAIEFSSRETKNVDGKFETLVVRVDDFGSYSALFREVDSSSRDILCETAKNSYWENARGGISFWSLGRGKVVACSSAAKCLSLELSKYVPFFAEQIVELAEVPSGTLTQSAGVPLCK